VDSCSLFAAKTPQPPSTFRRKPSDRKTKPNSLYADFYSTSLFTRESKIVNSEVQSTAIKPAKPTARRRRATDDPALTLHIAQEELQTLRELGSTDAISFPENIAPSSSAVHWALNLLSMASRPNFLFLSRLALTQHSMHKARSHPIITARKGTAYWLLLDSPDNYAPSASRHLLLAHVHESNVVDGSCALIAAPFSAAPTVPSDTNVIRANYVRLVMALGLDISHTPEVVSLTVSDTWITDYATLLWSACLPRWTGSYEIRDLTNLCCKVQEADCHAIRRYLGVIASFVSKGEWANVLNEALPIRHIVTASVNNDRPSALFLAGLQSQFAQVVDLGVNEIFAAVSGKCFID
jgi:hypothetical protein